MNSHRRLKIDALIRKIRELFPGEDPVPLHRPIIGSTEINFVTNVMQSSFVSSVGKEVEEFETAISAYTGANNAIAVMNGTSALHLALLAAGVSSGDEVITQALTFVATANAISYCGANPVFVDIDKETLGLSATSLRQWLNENAIVTDDGIAINKHTNAKISACLPMHTFGIPCHVHEITAVCKTFRIPVVEDAAEALGSFRAGKHVGTESFAGTISFNGNKVITTGGGGMILTNSDALASSLRHKSATSKVNHPYLYVHDQIGYNYRMPNINAALGLGQIERLPSILQKKRILFEEYKLFCDTYDIQISKPPEDTQPNNWLINIVCNSHDEQSEILRLCNENGIQCRPPWTIMSELPMYKNSPREVLIISEYVAKHYVSLPSSPFLDTV